MKRKNISWKVSKSSSAKTVIPIRFGNHTKNLRINLMITNCQVKFMNDAIFFWTPLRGFTSPMLNIVVFQCSSRHVYFSGGGHLFKSRMRFFRAGEYQPLPQVRPSSWMIHDSCLSKSRVKTRLKNLQHHFSPCVPISNKYPTLMNQLVDCSFQQIALITELLINQEIR